MRGNRTKVSIFGAILIALILYASISVSAALINIDGGSMNTECVGTSQDADGSPNSPTVPVDPGDTIFINVSVEASDFTASGIGSEHYFKLTVEYPGGVYRWNEWRINLTPMTNAGHTLSVWYKNVAGNETYSTTLHCWVQDNDSPWGYAAYTDYGTVTLT